MVAPPGGLRTERANAQPRPTNAYGKTRHEHHAECGEQHHHLDGWPARVEAARDGGRWSSTATSSVGPARGCKQRRPLPAKVSADRSDTNRETTPDKAKTSTRSKNNSRKFPPGGCLPRCFPYLPLPGRAFLIRPSASGPPATGPTLDHRLIVQPDRSEHGESVRIAAGRSNMCVTKVSVVEIRGRWWNGAWGRTARRDDASARSMVDRMIETSAGTRRSLHGGGPAGVRSEAGGPEIPRRIEDLHAVGPLGGG
ncbi:hypothetical protein FHX75_183 [Micromonospora palomenae]|uniref:Uncharacterized protein n=1 Tax=Micromonospora palomenae TaxID=1461247 RepID=A0A561VCE4_9ACTN|nr:hypothetical protein FHX75_183 [Micromonospora palomenae]